MAVEARRVIDFGCGTGAATPYFFKHLPVRSMWGLDVSEKSLEMAKACCQDYPIRFLKLPVSDPPENVDLAFSNGVFHHIPIDKRCDALGWLFAALRPQGLFAFWENNPWNPGTRYIMSRVPFDRDAIPVSPPEARRIVREAGFQIVRTDFLFLFPRWLRWFRSLEPLLMKLPLGAQYQVLCRKPE
jgi:SAM-dependent methyltransferase